jgi:K+-transporting ATPase ATPase C chain
MRTVLGFLRTASAGLRMLLALTVILGIAYPLLVMGIAQLPGLKPKADGSVLRQNGVAVGSSLLGQSYTDSDGQPLVQYFQTRPSAAGSDTAAGGDTAGTVGYDPTASGASNLGPESIVDTLPNPAVPRDTGTQSLLTQVCARSAAIGALDGVSGARPFCTPSPVTALSSSGTTSGSETSNVAVTTETAVGAVLAVFWSGPGYHGQVTKVLSVNQACPTTPFLAQYRGVPVQCMTYGIDISKAQIVPIRGNAPANPAVPPDAVTASGSGLDPDISVAYAHLQTKRVAAARKITVAQVDALVNRYTTGRFLGFMGEPVVNVVQLNLALDQDYPIS